MMTKEEKAAYMRDWLAKNKDRVNANRRAKHAANPNKKRERDRQVGT